MTNHQAMIKSPMELRNSGLSDYRVQEIFLVIIIIMDKKMIPSVVHGSDLVRRRKEEKYTIST